MNTQSRILIIEDNLDDASSLVRQLKNASFERHIRVIHYGRKALSYLKEGKIKREDLAAVFLDLNLPTNGGWKILEAIRTNDSLQNLPVIVMTSSNVPKDLDRCRALGVSSFVEKPLTLSSFAKAFSDTFAARRAATPLREEALGGMRTRKAEFAS